MDTKHQGQREMKYVLHQRRRWTNETRTRTIKERKVLRSKGVAELHIRKGDDVEAVVEGKIDHRHR